MSKGSEEDRLEQIAGFYHSTDATEGVDHFHRYLRDVTIPAQGGALCSGAGVR